MCETCGAINSRVRERPIRRNSSSPVASNCNIAEPNWKPCVHSVQPRLVYLPLTVNTGAPADGCHEPSIERIFLPASANTLRAAPASLAAVRELSILMREHPAVLRPDWRET